MLNEPYSRKAQEIMLKRIQQDQIDQSFVHAQEHLPETFGIVPMTYIYLELNGRKLVAFIDTGAQSTIISYACAERCGLASQIDKRFKGIAQGVGTGKIVGRIHVTQIKLGDKFVAASIIVLEDMHIDFIFGLDMLRRHQCCLNYKKNLLKLYDERIPFLSEYESETWKRLQESSVSSEPSNTPTIPAQQENLSSTKSSRNVAHEELNHFHITQLIALGATREEAIQLLRSANGDIDLASTLLWESKDHNP